MAKERKGVGSYYFLLTALGGCGVGFFVQFRKFERGFDSLINVRLLILMALFALAAHLIWEVQSFVLAHLLAKSREGVRKSFSLPFASLVVFFLYPLARQILFFDWQSSFRHMALLVSLLFLAAQGVALAKVLWDAGQRKHVFSGGRLFLILVGVVLLLYVHQLSYRRAYKQSGQWANLTIDHVTRRAVPWHPSLPYKFPKKIKPLPGGKLCLAVGPVDFLDDWEKHFRVSITLRDEGGNVIEKKSASVQMVDTWQEVRFGLGLESEEEMTVEVECRPVELMQKLKQCLEPPWLEPGYLIAFTQPRMVARNDATFPNVILISIDTLRADHVGAYGHFRSTPGIDALAKDGILFKNVVAPATWTLPSHMSIMTSLYPSYHGINDANLEVREFPLTTLSEIFQSFDYATAAFTGDLWISSRFGFSKGFDSYYERHIGGKANEAKEIFDRARHWINDHEETRHFLFLHTYEVHDYVAVRDHHKLYSDNDYKGMFRMSNFGKVLQKLGFNLREYDISEADSKFIKNLYNGAVSVTDKELEEFLVHLKSKGLYRDTLIVFTSDHGESFGEVHDSDFTAWYHRNIPYEEQVRVPLIFKLPAGSSERTSAYTEERISSLDIAPTILDICGLPVPETFQGVSAFDTKAKAMGSMRDIVTEQPELGIVALYRNSYVYIHYADSIKPYLHTNLDERRDELYNLHLDPTETVNRIGEERAEEMLSTIHDFAAESKRYRKQKHQNTELDEELRKQLRAVGYF